MMGRGLPQEEEEEEEEEKKKEEEEVQGLGRVAYHLHESLHG